MAHFRVLLRQDAWINYEAVIEATSKEEATKAALDSWKGDRDDIKLVENGSEGFDNVDIDPEEVEELTAEQFAEYQSEQPDEIVVHVPSSDVKTRLDEVREAFQLDVAFEIDRETFHKALAEIHIWLERF